MIVNYCFPAFGASIGDFEVASVKNVIKAVVLRKTLIK